MSFALQKEDSFDPNFVYHILNSFLFDNFLAKLSAGSTINHLYQKDFVDFTFKAPSELVEQQAIAQVLSDMDSEIEQLEKKVEKHNNLIERMAIVEQSTKSAHKRIDEMEERVS